MRGDKDDVPVGGLMMRILGALDVKEKWCFQAKYMVGVEISLADLIILCKPSDENWMLRREEGASR